MRAYLLVLAIGATTRSGAQSPARSLQAQSGVPGADTHSVVASAPVTTPPVIDGRGDDAAWASAAVLREFRMADPTEDGAPTFATEARIAYDARALYVLVRAYDPHPDSIVGRLSRRDVKTLSDMVTVMVDSYHDHRTGYEFAVNPAGVKIDKYTFADRDEDASWDAVWEVATSIDSLGWTAEYRIPLSQLRYPPGAERTFGIMIQRFVPRLNEHDSWPVYRKSRPGLSSQFGEIVALRDLGSPTHLEVTPYAISKNVSAPRPDGFARAQLGTMGADVKYAPTSNLTIDATVNPDFGQVEADPAQLNLSGFETFFNEQRPFFVEGTGIFDFGNDPTRLFYSRRIGRAPELSGLVSDPSATIPGASTILGAAKVSGRIAGGTSLGVLTAVTGREAVGSTTIEPQTSFGIARVSRDFRGGSSGIGGIVTVMRRELDAMSDPYLRREALTAGLDARHRFSHDTYSLRGSIAASYVDGSTAAITRTQRSITHDFQRPDDKNVVDTTATSLSGLTSSLSFGRVAGTFQWGASYDRTTPGFESNDVGFLGISDVQSIQANAQLIQTKPHGTWRNGNVQLTEFHNVVTSEGISNGQSTELDAYVETADSKYISLSAWADNLTPTYCIRCARGGPALRNSPDFNALWNFGGDSRKTIFPALAFINSVGDGGRSLLWRVRPYLTVQPRSNLSWEFGFRYQHNRTDAQFVDMLGTSGADTTHYLFARLHQQLLSMTARLNYTMTPALSLQLYGEPFVAAGHYDHLRELNTPRAANYDDRFRQFNGNASVYDFNDKEFHTSAVLRWEYRPGSTLFAVWTQGRGQFDRDLGSFAASRDYQNLFDARPDNTFLVKASYWIGR